MLAPSHCDNVYLETYGEYRSKGIYEFLLFSETPTLNLSLQLLGNTSLIHLNFVKTVLGLKAWIFTIQRPGETDEVRQPPKLQIIPCNWKLLTKRVSETDDHSKFQNNSQVLVNCIFMQNRKFPVIYFGITHFTSDVTNPTLLLSIHY